MHSIGSRLLLLSWALLLAVALAVGCSTHEPAAGLKAPTNTAAADGSAARPAHGPGPMRTAPMATVIPDTGNIDATLGQLTSRLRDYVVHTRSVPKDFEEFIAKSGVQAPPPPAGKKYAIQNGAVVLAKR